METPREVLFRTMQENWAISNKDLARALLLEQAATSGKSPQELIEVRSSLSRFVVHVSPGEYTYGWLAPYEESVPKVMGLVKRSRRPHASADVVEALAEQGAADMRTAFDAHGLDGALYANVSGRFAQMGAESAADASELLLWLFVVAGCSGDPARAAECAVARAGSLAAASALKTALPAEAAGAEDAAPLALGMYRCQDGVLLSDVYRLNPDGDGTEVGALSLTAHSVNDVGYGVSRRHLRIWRDDAGSWWVEGLGSTNGTVHVSGADGAMTVVEPPRADRAGADPCPVALLPGDRLVLAGTTEFTIVALPS